MPPKGENPAERSVVSSEIHKQLEHEIRMEIEYFLSKEGIEQNKTLADAQKQSQTGSIPIETLLGLERLKSLGVTRDVLMNACADSVAVEIDGDGSGIKRKAEKSLQEFEPEVSKKRKTENGASPAHVDDKDQDVKLFKVTLASGDPKLKDSALRSEIEKALGTEISYTRLKGREGYFSLDQSQISEDVKAKLAHAEVEIFGVTAKIQECWDDDLDQFYKKHGKHMDAFLERTGRRRKLRATKDEVDLVFYNKTYPSALPLEYLFQGIMSKTKNDEVINPADHQLLRELITYHDNFDELVKDLKHFTVGPHPTDLIARSFYAVKNDDTKVPFTFTDCYENLIDCFIQARKDIEVKE